MTQEQRHEFNFSDDGRALQSEREEALRPLAEAVVQVDHEGGQAMANLWEEHRERVRELQAEIDAQHAAAVQRLEAKRAELLAKDAERWEAGWDKRRARQRAEYRTHLKEADRLRMKPEDYFDLLRDRKKRGV